MIQVILGALAGGFITVLLEGALIYLIIIKDRKHE